MFNLIKTMHPNILFLVFDSFRADKFFGDDRTSKTPNLDLLVKKGTYFEQAVSSADGTFLTTSSIINGLYPFVTGVLANEIILAKDNFFEIIKKNDYHIYGLVPDLVPLSAIINYFENQESTFKVIPPLEKELFTDKLHTKILDFVDSQQIVEPWFYYLHIQDLHFPRIVPNDFTDPKFGNSDYDKIVSSIDFWLGKILEKVDLSNTLVIITADHGTHDVAFDGKSTAYFEPEFKNVLNLGKKILPKSSHETGAKMIINLRNKIRDTKLKKVNEGLTPYQIRSRLPHTTLSIYDESIRTPLLFVGKGITQNKIIPNQVSALDIFPTIMELIHSTPISSQIHGRSLIPLMQGKTFEDKAIFLHTIPHEQITSDDKIGVRTKKFKYFRTINEPKNLYLYDLVNDPHENNNIASSNPGITQKMENILKNFLENQNSKTEINPSKNNKQRTREQLEKMGYL